MEKIILLGPEVEITFTGTAYRHFEGLFGVPKLVLSGPGANAEPADGNLDILRRIQLNAKSYAALAISLRTKGRIRENSEGLIELLQKYSSTAECPFTIAGAIIMPVPFVLMAKAGVSMDILKGVLGHKEAIQVACKANIAAYRLSTIEVEKGNGEAARLVALDEKFRQHGAIGPATAADFYGLEKIQDNFGDPNARTNFLCLTPKGFPIKVGKENRIITVFKGKGNHPGVIHDVTGIFKRHDVNIKRLHSAELSDDEAHFYIELEIPEHKLEIVPALLEEFANEAGDHIVFGPFPLVDVSPPAATP